MKNELKNKVNWKKIEYETKKKREDIKGMWRKYEYGVRALDRNIFTDYIN